MSRVRIKRPAGLGAVEAGKGGTTKVAYARTMEGGVRTIAAT